MSTTYRPDDNWPEFTNPQQARLRREFASIKRSEEADKPSRQFTVLHEAPSKFSAGDVVFADGSNWDPSHGQGLYFRDKSNARLFPLRELVHIDYFGAEGDGTTDDTTAFTNAMAKAIAVGGELILDGTKTYALASAVALTSGLRLRTNGAALKCTTTTTSNTLFLTVNGDVLADQINVEIPAGVQRDRAISLTGDDISIGRISLTSTDVQATAESNDFGVRLIGDRIRVGSIRVTNYDRSVQINTCDDVTVGGLDISGYLRGLYILNSSEVKVGRSWIRTRSVNASATAGHVGVLISCSSAGTSHDITLEDFHIENPGEHAIRIGGPESQSNIYIVRPRIRDTQRSGIKILGTDTGTPTERNKSIVIDNPIIEDCGLSAGAATNCCGILVQFCDDVQILNPVIKPKNNASTAYYGILVDAADSVLITSPLITGAVNDGILMHATNGDNGSIYVNGGLCKSNGRHGVNIITDATRATRRCMVDGPYSDTNSDLGFNVSNSGTMVDVLLRIKTYNNTNGAGACNTTAVTLDVYGLPGGTALSGITANNGSRWSDGTTFNTRIGGAWIAQSSVLTGSATYDPPSLADGAGATTTVTVTGAALGDYATASFSLDLQGITLTAYVSAANTVTVRFQNESGGVIDLASGTLRARVVEV